MIEERNIVFEKNRQCGESYIRAFKANTTLKQVGDRWECECNKFLWSVSAPTKKQALLEGSYYFNQYYSDGEYND
jgi:hypothetical protein